MIDTPVEKGAESDGVPPRRRMVVMSGAIAGQLSQASVSFGLQWLAARALGAEGLGAYALVYGVIVTTGALTNGLVGDSLTVLDRSDSAIRSALQRWALTASILVSGVMACWLAGFGFIDWSSAAAYAIASTVFVLEGILRRLLMAEMRFWSVVATDLTGLAGSLTFLALWASQSPLSLEAMLWAWVAGQVLAGLAGIKMLPPTQRVWSRARPAAMRQVWSYGSFRAGQQLIRPTLMSAVRLLITVQLGTAALGLVEAARLYMAPAILVVQGFGSYLFASYAKRKNASLGYLVSRAQAVAAGMLVITILLGCLATWAAPLAGPLITGSAFSIDRVTVFGWALFAAATATNSPFASLAAVRGRQKSVIVIALIDAAVTLAVVAALLAAGFDAYWAPYVLAAGMLAQSVLLRFVVLSKPDASLSQGASK